jgi:hypothetical protein
MPEDTNEPQPKIIIDEDWKTQAQSEKERLAREQATAETAATSGPAESVAKSPSPVADQPAMQLPEASLTALVSMLATQVMVALGYVPHPVTGQPQRSLPEAKYLIDLISMLEEKTQGNRTPQEISILSSVLHEIRLAYVDAQKSPAPASPPTPTSGQ